MQRPNLGRRPVARGLVPRPLLFERLSAARPGEVILACAPAGSGKTVLLRSWLESEGLADRVAWVSVERDERDAQRFWLSVIDELAAAVGEAGLVERVGATPAFGGQAVVERLLSDLHSLEQPVVLVIDDLHELRSEEALRLLELFLTGLPPKLRVVLATREDPRLGLHRLRLAGALTEIRDADLRFSRDETRELLEATGIELSDEGVALLHERTEGWAAGLRLAAISLAGHPDPERFVTEFSGSERTVAGYLLAEVLERQPPQVRDLLLRTSVLERVSGPLADALTGGTGSEEMLQSLEDANAFVTSLDVGRSWFRYHHLLTDLLQLELRRTSPATVGSLHRAAAQWFEEHGYMVDADPALAGGARLGARRPPARRQLRRPRVRRPQGDAQSAAGRLPGRRARRPTRSWPWLSRRLDSTTACSMKVARTSPSRSGWPRPCPTSGGGCSTCGWPAQGSGWRVSAAISLPRSRRCGPSKPCPRPRRPTSLRAHTTIAPRR